MPFLYANGSAKLAYHFKLASDPEDMIITFGVRAATAPDAAELSAIYDAWADSMVAQMSNEYTFRGFEMVGKTSAGAEYAVELYSNQAGAVAGVFLPSNTALLLQKRTGLPGRKNRGRCYVPGHLQASQVAENGVVAAADIAALQTLVTAFYTDLTAEPTTGITDMAILHPDATFTLVTALVVDDVVATQRRRLR